ncbi:N-acetylmuramoyl-L-alanine amidase [Sebaldella sp. S0638]|uniref:N-acetylmuramoyl-L-alanine amidase n=1 Tax=Sebaldella sp. S0638 TaxID=2957809 RepID=UPI00209E6BD1|nr:N-acetylmuramoyl-L-alanine amidase [Sebaldella sp. S0638]MCP1226429.1 N-acetylmuramoyl-L-alanine amidase [Sebaldella sp. S0638]
MEHRYKDPKELIGVEFEESGQTYKITGIGETTEEFMTLFTVKVEKSINPINWSGKVLIDVGHGGSKTSASGKKIIDYGAVNSKTGMNEFMWNKDFVENYLLSELKKEGIKNQIVFRDTGITKLVQDLNKESGKDDIILSFHLNSDIKASGTETLYWHTSEKGKKLAGLIQKGLVGVLGLPDRGIKIRRKPLDNADALNQRGWTMFRDTKVPFVMLESFFITNDGDLKRGNEKKAELARALVSAIKEYIKG